MSQLELDFAPLSPKADDGLFYAASPHTYAAYRDGYAALWARMVVTKTAEASRQADLIIKHRAVYERVEAETGVPWLVIGLLHLREAGPQDVGRWKCILHNGQAIVGTGRKSTIVPKGVGPFATWHEAAVHAIRSEGLDDFEWNVERVAFASEKFNGFGYRNKGIVSPYLWGGTSVQQRGKYVRDGVFDRNVMDSQLGTMAILRVLMDKTGFTFGAPLHYDADPPADPAPEPKAETSFLARVVEALITAFIKRG